MLGVSRGDLAGDVSSFFIEIFGSLRPLPSLTQLVLKALSADVSTELDWALWEMPERGGVVAAWSRDDLLLTHFYAVAALRNEPPPAVPHGTHSGDLLAAIQWLSSQLDLRETPPWLDALRARPRLGPPGEVRDIDSAAEAPPPDLAEPALVARQRELERIHADAVKAEAAAEQDEVITAPLSRERIHGLEGGIDSDLRSSDGLARLYSSVDRLAKVDDCPDEHLRQWQTWSPRGFLTDLPGWGELPSREFAVVLVENRCAALLEALQSIEPKQLSDPRDLWSHIEAAVRDLAPEPSDTCFVVLSGDWRLYEHPDARFTEDWQLADGHPLKGSLHFEGEFLGMPVFQSYDRDGLQVWIAVVGRHGHYEVCQFAGRDFRLDIREFDHAAAEKVLATSPPLMRDGETLDHESAVREIRDQVLIRMVFGFTYRVDDETAAIVLKYPVDVGSD